MQGRQHQVTGLGGLDGNLGGFQIGSPHHDDVGILAQEGAQGTGEGEPRLGVDLHLVDAGQVDLNRILGGGDVDLAGIEDVETGIERHRLARPCGPGDQYHALWFGERMQVLRLWRSSKPS